MPCPRILLAALLLTSFSGARETHAFERLDFLEVGDELAAGAIEGERVRLAASRDGRHLYVTGDQADSLLFFSADPYSGELTLEETYLGPSPGLDQPNDVILTPDGGFVIVSQRGIQGVSVFTRNPNDGTLAFLEQQRSGIAGVTGLSSPERLALDPAGHHLYVLTPDSIVVFARESDGTLEFVEDESVDLYNDVFDALMPGIAVSPDGKHIYAVSPDEGHIVVFARDAATGALSFVENESAGGTLFPSALAVAPEGGFVYVATHPDCQTGGIAIFARNEQTGQLTYASTEVVEYQCLPTPRIEIRRTTGDLCFARVGEAVSPKAFYRCFARDPETGTLSLIDAGSGSGGSGFATSVSDVFSAGEFLFGAEPISNATDLPAISSIGFPILLPRETQQDGFDGVTGLDGAVASVVSPDGRHVYVASRFDGAVQIFTRDAETGGLEAAGEVRQGIGGVTSLSTPTDLAISGDGKHVYVTASTSDALTVFSRNATSGALTLVEVESDGQNGVTLFQAPSGVTVSPDGRFVLATSAGEDAVVSFARNATSGALTFADDYSGLLDQASDVAVSPDNAHAYVTAEGSHTLTALTLGNDGSLAFLQQRITPAVAGAVYGARDVVVSPDGKNLYVAGTGDPRVAVYTRDASTGVLAFLESLDAEPGGETPSIGGGDGVAITPDGRFVFAGDVHANTQDVLRLTYWRRDPETGRLFFRGLDQGSADHIAVSPDGRNLYVTSFGGDRLAVFAPEPARGAAIAAVLLALAALVLARSRST